MFQLLQLLIILSWSASTLAQPTFGGKLQIQQSGAVQGLTSILNCTTNVTCTCSGGVCTISATGGGGGGVDCTTGPTLFCLAGRAGGQVAHGGTGATDVLNLTATSASGADGLSIQRNALGVDRLIIGPNVDPTSAVFPPGITDFLIVDQGFAGANLGTWAVGSTSGASFFGIQSGGTALAPTATVDGATIFSITAIGTDATGAIFTIPEAAKLSIVAKLPGGVPQTGFVPGQVVLNTTDSVGASNPRFMVDPDGRIGLNEGAPVGNPGDLSIKAKTFIGPPPSGPSNPGNANAGLELQAGTGNSFALMNFQLTDANEAGFATPAGGMQFYNLDGGSGHDRFRGRLQSHWGTFILDDGAGNVAIPGNLSATGSIASGTLTMNFIPVASGGAGTLVNSGLTDNGTTLTAAARGLSQTLDNGTSTSSFVSSGANWQGEVKVDSGTSGDHGFIINTGSIQLFASDDSTNYSRIDFTGPTGTNNFVPSTGHPNLGASSAEWSDFWTRGALHLKGNAPSCGSGCSSVSGSDRDFDVTTSALATSATVNFSATLSTTPVCLCNDNSVASFCAVTTTSTTSVTFGLSAALTGHVYAHCFQNA